MSDPLTEGAKGIQSDKPIPPGVAQLQKAMAMASAGQNALFPYLKRLEYFDRELQRTHETIRVKIESRLDIRDDHVTLQSLRLAFVASMDDLGEKVTQLETEKK